MIDLINPSVIQQSKDGKLFTQIIPLKYLWISSGKNQDFSGNISGKALDNLPKRRENKGDYFSTLYTRFSTVLDLFSTQIQQFFDHPNLTFFVNSHLSTGCL